MRSITELQIRFPLAVRKYRLAPLTKFSSSAPSEMATFLLQATPFCCPSHRRNPSLKPSSPVASLQPRTTVSAPKSVTSLYFPSDFRRPFPHRTWVLPRTSPPGSETSGDPLVGEDSAVFVLGKQSVSSWIYFTVILGAVLFVLQVAWMDNTTGFGKAYIDAISSLTDSHEIVMLILIVIFATVHSGLASLRDVGESIIGERAFRVLFAGSSLPLAVSTIVYFINHRYDGVQLWQLQGAPGIHELVWLSNFVSFFFLYPSTFNLLEVAAVDKPKMHLWETGIMRITRHPQMVGQVIWCLAHTIWIGNSVAVSASAGLILHHLFGVWNGDRRLAKRYGKAFELVKMRTSVMPFAAILEGRQVLPDDYYKEFLRLPYLTITGLTLAAYFLHPLMQAGSFQLHW